MRSLFQGKSAITDFLNPRNHPSTPLVELPESLTPGHDKGVRIYCKMMTSLPLMNVKSLAAYEMLAEVDTEKTNEIVEASSGNTAYSVAMIANSMGISNVTALVSKEVTPAKLKLLQIAGAKVEIVNEPICPEPNNPDGAISIARKRGQEQGVVNLDQYSNSKNPAAHQELTARQVYDQLSGQVDYFVAGMGTTGTILGSAHFFREQDGNTQLIGVARKPNNYVPGIRTENLLAEVEFDWQDYVDEIFVVGTKDSFAWSLELIRHGLPAGPSAGFAYAGALEIANKYADDGQYVDAGPVNIVFICPDSPLPYLDDYFTYLPIENFKKMINEHLLDEDVTQNSSYTEIEEMNADELYEKLDDFYLLDVRSAKEFEDHHIEGSVNMTLDELVQHLPELKQIKKPVVVICKTGARSHQASLILSKLGVKSKTLEGGTSEWSSRGYQRITPDYCKRQP